MKQTILIIIVFLLFILNIILVFSYKKQKEKTEQRLYMQNIQIENQKFDMQTLRTYTNQQIKFSLYRLNDFILYGENEAFLFSKIAENIKLIYYAPENACNPCYEDITNQFGNILNKIGKENFFIIVSEKRYRDIKVYFKDKNINIPVFYIKNKDLLPEVLEGNVPYFFLLDASLKIKHLFIPDKNNQDYLADYIRIVGTRYFND